MRRKREAIAWCRCATGPKELVILDGEAHAQFIFETSQGSRLLWEIVRFLQKPVS